MRFFINEKNRLQSITELSAYLQEGEFTVTVIRQKDKASANQSGYLWGCVYKIISDYTGEDPESLHQLFKKKFLSERVEVGGERLIILKNSSRLSKKEYSEFIDKIVVWAWHELGLDIPMASKEQV